MEGGDILIRNQIPQKRCSKLLSVIIIFMILPIPYFQANNIRMTLKKCNISEFVDNSSNQIEISSNTPTEENTQSQHTEFLTPPTRKNTAKILEADAKYLSQILKGDLQELWPL